MNILITGGLGFIGSNLAIYLSRAGHQITIVDAAHHLDHGWNTFNIKPVQDKVEFIKLNLATNPKALMDILTNHLFDIIYDFAGQINHIDSLVNPQIDLENNFLAHLNLLESIKKNPSAKPLIIYLSTRQIYGKPRYLPVDENHPIQIVDNNGIHKIMSEEYFHLYHQLYQFNTIILRISNIYGPRQYIKNNKQGFIGFFLGLFLKRAPITIFGDGHQMRDFLFIDDLIDLLAKLPFKTNCFNKIYNVGSGISYTINDFVNTLYRIDSGFSFQYLPFPPLHQKIDIGDYVSNINKVKTDTEWQPQVDLKQGLNRTIEFFRLYLEEYL